MNKKQNKVKKKNTPPQKKQSLSVTRFISFSIRSFDHFYQIVSSSSYGIVKIYLL